MDINPAFISDKQIPVLMEPGKKFTRQPNGVFQYERSSPPIAGKLGALCTTMCAPASKTGNHILYQCEVSEYNK